MERQTSNDLVRATLTDIIDTGNTYKTGRSKSIHSQREFREVMGSLSILSNPRNRIFTSQIDPTIFDPGLAAARFFYMLSGSNKLEPIAFYSEGVRKFSDDGEYLNGSSYGYRLFGDQGNGDNQVEKLINLLKTQSNSTRGTLAIYSAEDCGKESKDIPCALNFTLSPRDEVLHGTLSMRANAGLRLMPYNIFEFTMIQEWIANQCNFALGKYYHSVVSMHLREDELKLAPIIADEKIQIPEMDAMPSMPDDFQNALRSEEERIMKNIKNWTAGDVIQQIQTLFQKYDKYWVDLLSVLILRGFRSTHNPKDLCELLSKLGKVNDGPLLSTAKTTYNRIEQIIV